MIKAKAISKRFKSGTETTTVINNCNLEITQGELVVLKGRSGSGKTTLLHMLAGVDLPSEGEITLDGTYTISAKSKRHLVDFRRHIGFSHQTPVLIPTLSALENVVLPFSYLGKKPDLEWIKWLFKQFEINNLEHRSPKQLSGGQATRVALCRALARKNSLIVVDEPTSRLDSTSAAKVWQTLEWLAIDQKLTVVVSSHDPLITSNHARVIHIDNGQLA